MLRKTNDSPLNLIRILPPREGASRSNRYNPASTHFKIQLDADEPKEIGPWFGGVPVWIKAVVDLVNKIGRWNVNQVKRIAHFIGTVVSVITRGFVLGVLKIGQFIKFFGRSSMNLARQIGGWVGSAVGQGWPRMTEGKKPFTNDSIQRERSKQREMLIEEVHALRTQLSTHQDELIRVTAQMGELKALVLSQQQVLLHLGKELEATERTENPSERFALRKTKPRAAKSAKPKKSESSEPMAPTQFELGPPHH